MTSAYIRREILTGTIISVVISVCIAVVLLGGRDEIPLRGGQAGVAFDAMPQTFFVALMAILMPIVNASRHQLTDRSVRQPVIWAGATGAATGLALIGYLGHLTLLPGAEGEAWSPVTVVAWKAAYSAVLASGLSLGVHVWLRRGACLRPRSPRRGTPSGSTRIAA